MWEIDAGSTPAMAAKFRRMKMKNELISIFAKNTCGCCTADMKFKNVKSAEEAFAKAGLGCCDIVDDLGESHRIDTFYGFSLSDDEQSSRGLKYLADKVDDIIGQGEQE